MNLIERYYEGFQKFGKHTAFNLNGETINYDDFQAIINGCRKLLESQSVFSAQQPVGIVCDDTAETYAAIFAVWFSGGIFVPLSPALPSVVLDELIDQYAIRLILCSDPISVNVKQDGVKILKIKDVVAIEHLPLYSWNINDRMYILTTSGSTGTPKSVPICLKNVEAFIEGFLEVYPELSESDQFLQTYELTADAAFTGFLIPMLLGATVHLIPSGGFKPFKVVNILTTLPITWVQVTPTLLACLRPFFSSLNLKNIKHFHFGGEALPAELVEEWRPHVPNAEISNVYGPTETTITATAYKCRAGERLLAKKNIVSIGKPLKKVECYIHKEAESEFGELFIAGDQVMGGYLNELNQPFKHTVDRLRKFFPTGDFVDIDDYGFLYYYGRKDEQVKVNGYRIDLIEIENKIREKLPKAGNVAATVIEQFAGLSRICVFIEGYTGNGNEILQQMQSVLPKYKIPDKIIGVINFPLLSSGKTDKKALVKYYNETGKKDVQQ